jgi:hypothetical protein
MTVYDGLITVSIDGKDQPLNVEITLDETKLMKHLLKCYNHAFITAAKKGDSRVTKLGGALVMKAGRVNIQESDSR